MIYDIPRLILVCSKSGKWDLSKFDGLLLDYPHVEESLMYDVGQQKVTASCHEVFMVHLFGEEPDLLDRLSNFQLLLDHFY